MKKKIRTFFDMPLEDENSSSTLNEDKDIHYMYPFVDIHVDIEGENHEFSDDFYFLLGKKMKERSNIDEDLYFEEEDID